MVWGWWSHKLTAQLKHRGEGQGLTAEPAFDLQPCLSIMQTGNSKEAWLTQQTKSSHPVKAQKWIIVGSGVKVGDTHKETHVPLNHYCFSLKKLSHSWPAQVPKKLHSTKYCTLKYQSSPLDTGIWRKQHHLRCAHRYRLPFQMMMMMQMKKWVHQSTWSFTPGAAPARLCP